MTAETAKETDRIDIKFLGRCLTCGSDHVAIQKVADAKSIICLDCLATTDFAPTMKEAEAFWFSGRTMPGPNEPPVWLRLYIEALMLLDLGNPVVAEHCGTALQERNWPQDVRGWQWTRRMHEIAEEDPVCRVPSPRRGVSDIYPVLRLDRYEQQVSPRDILIGDARREFPVMAMTRSLARTLQPRLAERYMLHPAFYVGVSDTLNKEVYWAPAAGAVKEVEEIDLLGRARLELCLKAVEGSLLEIFRVVLRDSTDHTILAWAEAEAERSNELILGAREPGEEAEHADGQPGSDLQGEDA